MPAGLHPAGARQGIGVPHGGERIGGEGLQATVMHGNDDEAVDHDHASNGIDLLDERRAAEFLPRGSVHHDELAARADVDPAVSHERIGDIRLPVRYILDLRNPRFFGIASGRPGRSGPLAEAIGALQSGCSASGSATTPFSGYSAPYAA